MGRKLLVRPRGLFTGPVLLSQSKPDNKDSAYADDKRPSESWQSTAVKGGREGGREGAARMGRGRKGEREGRRGGAGDLLLSGDLMRVAEEEERRLLMPASGGSFRFMVDVERLSTGREGGRTDKQGRRGLHWRLAKGRRRRRKGVWGSYWDV